MVREIHIAVKGRVRYHVKGLYRCAAFKQRLEAVLPKDRDILSASASILTGNLLVLFHASCNPRRIFTLVEGLALDYSGGRSRGVERLPGLVPVVPSDAPSELWHLLDEAAVVEKVGTSPTQGLFGELVERSRETYGANVFPEPEVRSGLDIFIDQFKSVPVAMLGASAVVSVFTGGLADALVIGAVVLINAAIGYLTESDAEKTIQSLRNSVRPPATVLREGQTDEVDASLVVVGDMLLLRPGSYIAADARLIEAVHLTVDESILTGESMPVIKSTGSINDAQIPLADRVNMIYAGTLVTGGRGSAVVVATGSRTEMGKIRALVLASEPPQTPVERQLTTIGNQLVLFSAAVCGVVFVMGLLRGNPILEMLKTSISLAVAAVPEGLPAVATTTLALGIKHMRAHKVLIRDLEAICTLGSVQTICFDKTGTVTLNQMSVIRIFSGSERIDIGPEGVVLTTASSDDAAADRLLRMVEICTLCNESEVTRSNGSYVVNGTPTENALIYLAIVSGVDVEHLRSRYPRLQTNYRSDDRHFMSTVHQAEGNKTLLALKGNPVEVLAKCSTVLQNGDSVALTEEDRDHVEAENDAMAGDALRVLGVGFALLDETDDPEAEDSFVWLGLVGMADPIRTGVKESIRSIHRAGLETVMLTGDQSPTAYAVGRELGLNNGKALEILDSTDLPATDFEVLKALCTRVQVFSRVSPSDKLQIVQALQSTGKVVAMTGDGINDGPALKAADIGIAMGRGGTDVARDVADVILEEDDLDMLIIAIRDGRTIYRNIRKTLHYLLATNFSEIQVMFLGAGLGLGHPLNAIQLLWLNLVSDIFPGLALALEPPEDDVMETPPRDPLEPIVKAEDFKRITFESTALTASSMAAYGYGLMRYGASPTAGTLAFQTLTCAQILHAFTCRSETHRLLDRDRPSNPFLNVAVFGSLALQVIAQLVPGLRSLLGTTPITALDGAVVAAMSLLPMVVSEATKTSGEVRKP